MGRLGPQKTTNYLNTILTPYYIDMCEILDFYLEPCNLKKKSKFTIESRNVSCDFNFKYEYTLILYTVVIIFFLIFFNFMFSRSTV